MGRKIRFNGPNSHGRPPEPVPEELIQRVIKKEFKSATAFHQETGISKDKACKIFKDPKMFRKQQRKEQQQLEEEQQEMLHVLKEALDRAKKKGVRPSAHLSNRTTAGWTACVKEMEDMKVPEHLIPRSWERWDKLMGVLRCRPAASRQRERRKGPGRQDPAEAADPRASFF